MRNSEMSETLNGYVTVRSFGGMALPVPVQNMLLRNYCESKGFTYSLPLNEHKYDGCYMQLFATLEVLTEGGHIGMCSAFMLPVRPELFREFAGRALRQRVSVHCLFESVIARTESDFSSLGDLLRLRKLTDRVDSDVAALKRFLTVAGI